MAAHNLSVLSSPDFPQALAQMVSRLEIVVRRAEIVTAEAHLTTCYWDDEHCDCRDLATVHHIPSELEFCERHFQMIEKGVVML